MSEGKWLIYEGYMEEKLSDIVNTLKSDIEYEKQKDEYLTIINKKNSYSPIEPYKRVLDVLEVELSIIRKKLIETHKFFFEDYETHFWDYQKKHYPQWNTFFKTKYPK